MGGGQPQTIGRLTFHGRKLKMRAFIAALVTLFLLFGLAITNYCIVQAAGERLLDAEASLPEQGSDAEKEIGALRALWEEKKGFLELSVRRDLLHAAESALVNIENLSRSGENADYLAAKDAFYLAIRTILRLEHPSAESVF